MLQNKQAETRKHDPLNYLGKTWGVAIKKLEKRSRETAKDAGIASNVRFDCVKPFNRENHTNPARTTPHAPNPLPSLAFVGSYNPD